MEAMSQNERQQAATSLDATGSMIYSSYPPSSPDASYPGSMVHHTARYVCDSPDCPWSSYDNVPPTPAAAFLDDPEIEGGYHDYHSGYDLPQTPRRSTTSANSEASPRPMTPMGALATPPQGYEWYITPTYQAYLVPLAGTASTPAHVDSTSSGTSMTLATHGLPTPPPETVNDYRHSCVDRGRRGLPVWLSANLEQELVDVMDERDQVWTRKKRASARH